MNRQNKLPVVPPAVNILVGCVVFARRHVRTITADLLKDPEPVNEHGTYQNPQVTEFSCQKGPAIRPRTCAPDSYQAKRHSQYRVGFKGNQTVSKAILPTEMASADRFLFTGANGLFSNTSLYHGVANLRATNDGWAAAHASSLAGNDSGHLDNNNRHLSISNRHVVQAGGYSRVHGAATILPRIPSCRP